MAGELLKVEGLKAGVEDKEILHGVDLSVGAGEVHVIMGPNGCGKSTLGTTIMGDPRYKINGGHISFDGDDITGLSADKIARKGIFYAFQAPIEVPGVSMRNFIRSSLEAVTGERVTPFNLVKMLKQPMELLGLDDSYLDRDLNVGFSGGEKKKAEILQLLMIKPKLAILDETDSGLDVDAVKMVANGIKQYRTDTDGSLLIITHNRRLLKALNVDRTHVMYNGRIVEEGDASLVDKVLAEGFKKYIDEDKEGEDK